MLQTVIMSLITTHFNPAIPFGKSTTIKDLCTMMFTAVFLKWLKFGSNLKKKLIRKQLNFFIVHSYHKLFIRKLDQVCNSCPGSMTMRKVTDGYGMISFYNNVQTPDIYIRQQKSGVERYIPHC